MGIIVTLRKAIDYSFPTAQAFASKDGFGIANMVDDSGQPPSPIRLRPKRQTEARFCRFTHPNQKTLMKRFGEATNAEAQVSLSFPTAQLQKLTLHLQ